MAPRWSVFILCLSLCALLKNAQSSSKPWRMRRPTRHVKTFALLCCAGVAEIPPALRLPVSWCSEARRVKLVLAPGHIPDGDIEDGNQNMQTKPQTPGPQPAHDLVLIPRRPGTNPF